MNGSKDFAELNANEATKRRIALMLGMWNKVMDDGQWRLEYMRDVKIVGWKSVGKQLGLLVGTNQVSGLKK